MPAKKYSGHIESKYSASGSRQRKLNAQAGRAPASSGTPRRRSGMDVFRETLYDKKK